MARCAASTSVAVTSAIATADRAVAEMNRYSMLLPARGVSTPLASHTWIVTLATAAASVSRPDII